MKKALFLAVILLCCAAFFAKAQTVTKEQYVWLDFQMVQSFGLNNWNRVKFASDRLPCAASLTELRATLNVYVVRPAGLFADMGVGIMPAPRNGLADPAGQATLCTGVPYYTKEVTVENGYQTASGHFKMTFGFFGKIPTGDKLSVSAYLGAGFMTSISVPTCEAVLKEENTNMQYIARYQWFGKGGQNSDGYGYEQDGNATLGYLAYRLRFACPISPKLNLLFGVEYTWHFTHADFSETYTNYFNRNIVKINNYKGNRLNMLGVSLGISF